MGGREGGRRVGEGVSMRVRVSHRITSDSLSSLPLLSHPYTGQFWNVPVTAEEFNGTMTNGEPAEGYFRVSVSHPDSPTRNFPGFFWPLTWEQRSEPCLYSGSSNAGSVQIINGLEDTVIEGVYADYIVSGAFETEFLFSRFSDGICN